MYQNPEALFGGSARLLELIEQVYAGVSDPSLWPGILDRIADAVKGRQTFMFTDTPDPAMPRALIGTRTDPEALTQFLDRYAFINPMAEPADAVFRDGEVRYSHWVMDDSDLERSEFYNDFFRPFDMHWSYGAKIPVISGASPVYVSCQRPKSMPAFADREGAVLRVLMPHFQRAFALHRETTVMGNRVAALEGALNSSEHAVFGVDGAGRVVFCNRRGDGMLRSGSALRLRDGRLETALHACSADFRTLLAGKFSGGAMLVRQQPGGEAIRVWVTPTSGSAEARFPLVTMLVFANEPQAAPKIREEVLRTLYSLSPAEARIAQMLLGGLEIKEIAEQLGNTIETVRFQVKRILAKTGCKRQAELVGVLSSLPREAER